MITRASTGNPPFVSVLARYLAETRGVRAAEGEMLTTRGSRRLSILRQKHCLGRGRSLRSRGWLPTGLGVGFRLAGAELVGLPTDEEGLVVDELRALCDEREVCAVYTTPHHQYPTTVTMSARRRIALLALAEEKRFVIIEDDYDHEYHFAAEPVLPLASQDEAGVVLHIGTLSKVFAPGLRLGYAVGAKAPD